MNKTESCYARPTRTVTVHSPKVMGTPIRMPVKVRTESGAEKTISRREYKRWRKEQKRSR